MLLSTRSGGVGLNLIGADTVVFYDIDWNPTMDLQAQDRCHRIGQTRPVTIYRLISEHTVEERILMKSRERKMLNNLVIRGGNFGAIGELDPTISKSDAVSSTVGLGSVNLRSFFHDLDEDADLDCVQDSQTGQEVRQIMEQLEDADDVQALQQAEAELLSCGNEDGVEATVKDGPSNLAEARHKNETQKTKWSIISQLTTYPIERWLLSHFELIHCEKAKRRFDALKIRYDTSDGNDL